MIIQIEPHSGVPIYRQIMDQIRGQVLAGVVKAGAQVPTVRQLAGEIQVNPMTISKAYAFLEREGILNRKRGVGLYVAELDGGVKLDKQRLELNETLRAAGAQARLFGLDFDTFIDLAGQAYRAGEPEQETNPIEGVDYE